MFLVQSLALAWAASAVGLRGDAVGPEPVGALLDRYCLNCHGEEESKGGLSLEELNISRVAASAQTWESVLRKLEHRQMPPVGRSRPEEATYVEVIARIRDELDRNAVRHPNPGRTDTFRRLNRTEYQNAIRDLVGIEVNAADWLPNDESSHGFDTVSRGDLPPMLIERYLTAAQRISRLVMGATTRSPEGTTIRVKPDVTQDDHVEGLPLGTRGGTLIRHLFVQEGEYDFEIRLARDREEEVEGLTEPHELQILVNREVVRSFALTPPMTPAEHYRADAHLKQRIPVKAGLQEIGVTFVRRSSGLLETTRQPLNVHFNRHRHPRLGPAVYEVSITGPFAGKGPETNPARLRLLAPGMAALGAGDQVAAARQVLTPIVRRAYRRPVGDADIRKPLEFFERGCREGGFDAGIELALAGILVSPEFLFRIQEVPPGAEVGAPYRVSSLELASRLSFFLWSSIPDDELLDAAVRGDLEKPSELERQVRRMLADDRAGNLASNFGGQWLHLRNLEASTPDMRLYPDFDDNLRQAMRRETELLLDSVIREDRSVLDLLRSDYTFLNERLARHYGIPGIHGSRFRRVSASGAFGRGGLLRHGSLLTVTSYATRTSPVIRGKWVLENLLGTPPPPPLPDVAALDENSVSAGLPMRERLAIHRSNTACAGCHNLMDPIGFSLENFDAVGRWRNRDEGRPVDASGSLPGGQKFEGVDGLERALLERPDLFAAAVTEKLLVFALGRGIEYYDGPAVRQIVRDAQADRFRFSQLILGIVRSTPFQMRNPT